MTGVVLLSYLLFQAPIIGTVIDPLTLDEARQWLYSHPINKPDVRGMKVGESATIACELYYANVLVDGTSSVKRHYYVAPQTLLNFDISRSDCQMIVTRDNKGVYFVEMPGGVERRWSFRNAVKSVLPLLIPVRTNRD